MFIKHLRYASVHLNLTTAIQRLINNIKFPTTIKNRCYQKQMLSKRDAYVNVSF